MKFNLFALGRAVRALIITVVVFCLIGALFCPELVQYTPEDPDLMSHQKGFALATFAIGLLAGALMYWEALRK